MKRALPFAITIARPFRACVVGALIALVGCPKEKPIVLEDASTPAAAPSVSTSKWDPAVRTAAIAEGAKVLEQHQCNRCHGIDQLAAPARPLHCTSCHVFLKGVQPGQDAYAKLVKSAGEAILKRYQSKIVHLQQVPLLTGIGKRVRADWIAKFLEEPFDVRPLVEESMIRHNLKPDEIKKVARYFAAVAEAPDPFAPDYQAPQLPKRPDETRLAAGKKLFGDKGCTACHTYGNVKWSVTKEMLEGARPASLLAPNLRFARERVRPEVLVAWILDPQKILPGTPMPSIQMTQEEAETLRDFVLFGDPELIAAPPLPSTDLPPKITRTITYAEMKERVLGKVCVHCHMNDYEKDPGPGNRGGLGYKGVQLQMRTYETLVYGAIDAKGERYSVLVPRNGEAVPPILQAMMRRRVEAVRDQVPAFGDYDRPHYPSTPPGMPLGLPAMTDEEVGILAAWIEQGCVGPTEVKGTPGMNDGFLVPDGPIEKNKGCELRPPSKTRPAWAIESEKKSPAPAASGSK